MRSVDIRRKCKAYPEFHRGLTMYGRVKTYEKIWEAKIKKLWRTQKIGRQTWDQVILENLENLHEEK